MKATKTPLVKFGDVVRQVKDIVDPQACGLERYIAGEHMSTDDLHIHRWGIIGDNYLGPAFHMRFKPGHVLYGSRRTYLRKVALADFEGICANTTYVLESKDPEILLPGLLPFIMQTETFHDHSKKQSKGSVNPYINFSDIAWYEFPLPPIDEQRRIADLLWAVDEVLIEWQETLKCLEKLLLSVRENILCHKTLPRQKLKICVRNITAGKSLLGAGRVAKNNEYGVIKVSAIGCDGFIPAENKVLIDASEFIRDYSVQANDILISRANTRELVGRVCLVPREYPNLMLSDKTLRIDVYENSCDKSYLTQVLRSKEARNQIESVASGTGGAMKNITQAQILNFTIPLPDIACQKEITIKMQNIELSIEQVRNHINKFIKVKTILLNNITV